MQLKYQKGQTYINKFGTQFDVSGLWFLGFNLTGIELIKKGGNSEFYYTLNEFETAINEGKLILKT